MSVIGTVVEKEVLFYNTSGVLADPTTVTATVKKPDDTTASGTVVNTAVGKYDLLFTADQAGIWYWRVVAAGNNVDVVAEGSFCVQGSSVI